MSLKHLSRRDLLKAGAAAAGAALLPSVGRCLAAEPSPRPNIVLIILDTVRADHLSCYGYQRETTPNIDAFAKTARLYRNVLAPSCYTLPTHVSMFTGLSTSAHGADWSHQYMSTGFPTLAEQLAAAGYETMGFSCSVMFVCKRTGLNRGFKDLWTPDEHAQIAGETAGQQSRSPQRAAAMNQELTKWLSENRGSGKPFFLFVNYFDAHQPYVSPKKSKRFASDETRDAWESEDMAHVLLDHTLTGKDIIRNDEIAGLVDLYDDAVRYVDAKVGEVLAYLKKTGLDQNTAVLIASDHGDHFGDHHMMSHQFSLYEPLVRVPLIARWPDGSASGVEERLVQCHDVYPTILELAGLNWNRLPGQTCESLRSPLADGRLGISEYLVPYLSALGRVPRVYPAVDCSRFARRLRAVQRDKMKLIVPSDGSLELYDLAADPMELDNLVGEKPSLVRELSAELDTWRRSFSHYVPKPMPDGARKYRFTKNELETMRGNGYLQSASPQND